MSNMSFKSSRKKSQDGNLENHSRRHSGRQSKRSKRSDKSAIKKKKGPDYQDLENREQKLANNEEVSELSDSDLEIEYD